MNGGTNGAYMAQAYDINRCESETHGKGESRVCEGEEVKVQHRWAPDLFPDLFVCQAR